MTATIAGAWKEACRYARVCIYITPDINIYIYTRRKSISAWNAIGGFSSQHAAGPVAHWMRRCDSNAVALDEPRFWRLDSSQVRVLLLVAYLVLLRFWALSFFWSLFGLRCLQNSLFSCAMENFPFYRCFVSSVHWHLMGWGYWPCVNLIDNFPCNYLDTQKWLMGNGKFIKNSLLYLGKLSYFTDLNLAAIKGDDFPQINHNSRVRENRLRSLSFSPTGWFPQHPLVMSK